MQKKFMRLNQSKAKPELEGDGDEWTEEGELEQPHPSSRSDEIVVRLILPDESEFKYTLNVQDPFWALFGRVVHDVKDLVSGPFTFVMNNGHVLEKKDFHQTLASVGLVPPGGDVRVNYCR